MFVTDGCFNVVDLIVASGAGAAFAPVPEPKVHCIFEAIMSPKAARDAFANSVLGEAGSGEALNGVLSDQSKVADALAECKVDPSLVK